VSWKPPKKLGKQKLPFLLAVLSSSTLSMVRIAFTKNAHTIGKILSYGAAVFPGSWEMGQLRLIE